MGKKKFDKDIKEKLEGLQINYDAASWDSFEQKLDNAMAEEEIADLEFDQQIKDKIQNQVNFDFEEEHWQELSSRIDLENELTNKIYLFKIIELVILVLLAYSFFQIEPIKDPGKNLTLYAHSEIFNSIDAEQVLAKEVEKTAVVKDNFNSPDVLNPIILDREEVKIYALTNGHFKKSPPRSINKASDISIPLVALNQVETQGDISETEVVSQSELVTEEEKQQAERELLAINSLDDQYESLLTIPAFAKKGNEKWFSFSASADINLVNTPTNFLINGRDKLLGAAGVSSSIGYSVKAGKNEYGIGLGYSYKSYDPELKEVYAINNDNSINTSTNTVYQTSLNRILFHVAQIPATYKRYLVDNHKWSAYASLGVTHNFIMYSDYDLPDVLLSGTWNSRTRRKANSDLLRRTYYTGLLQNIDQPKTLKNQTAAVSSSEFRTEGDIFDNAFITSYTGFGLQRKLGYNRSIFMQAGYHHQFFGDKLGPNDDQINTFSFTLGGKFRI